MRNLSVSLLLIIISFSGWTQIVLSTAGEEFTSPSGKLSWTIGEPVIETFSSGNNILTQGFEQDYLNLLSTQELSQFNGIRVCPNPTSDLLQIESSGQLKVSLFTNDGKELNIPIEYFHDQFLLNLTELRPGIYHLKISKDQIPFEFKIIKL
jgi:hypothetical protein